MQEKKVKPGKHPNSLKNLKLGGNKLRYEQPKKRRSISLTDEGWDKCRQLTKENFGLSVSEFMEQLGRGEIDLEVLKKAMSKPNSATAK